MPSVVNAFIRSALGKSKTQCNDTIFPEAERINAFPTEAERINAFPTDGTEEYLI